MSENSMAVMWVGPLLTALRVSTPEAAIARVDALLAIEARHAEVVNALRMVGRCRRRPPCHECRTEIAFALRDESEAQ